jgi:hypothetical protein
VQAGAAGPSSSQPIVLVVAAASMAALRAVLRGNQLGEQFLDPVIDVVADGVDGVAVVACGVGRSQSR